MTKERIKRGQRLVILPDRRERHGKPVERRHNRKGEPIPLKIADGPTIKYGKRNVQGDNRPAWWGDK